MPCDYSLSLLLHRFNLTSRIQMCKIMVKITTKIITKDKEANREIYRPVMCFLLYGFISFFMIGLSFFTFRIVFHHVDSENHNILLKIFYRAGVISQTLFDFHTLLFFSVKSVCIFQLKDKKKV